MPAKKKAAKKVAKVMREYKKGELRSGSKKGPKVTSRKQAVAIAMSEAGISRKEDAMNYRKGGTPSNKPKATKKAVKKAAKKAKPTKGLFKAMKAEQERNQKRGNKPF